MLTTIIEILEEATGLPVKPLFTDSIEDVITYKWELLRDDGAVQQDRLELRLITKTVADAEVYKQQIVQALVNVGDCIKIDGILNCDNGGGGQLYDYDTETIHTLIFFDITTRSYIYND